MIVIDTHIWIWSVQSDRRLDQSRRLILQQYESFGLGVSAISLWEVAKAVQLGRLVFSVPVDEWLQTALGYPGIKLIPLTPDIVAESVQLPGIFHRDPSDEIIVATARVLDVPLVTVDRLILKYPHVKLLP